MINNNNNLIEKNKNFNIKSDLNDKELFKQKLNKTLKQNESLFFEIIIGDKIILWEQKNYSIDNNIVFYVNLLQTTNQYFTIKIFKHDLYIKLGNYGDEKIVVFNEKELNELYYFKLDENEKLIQYKINGKNKLLKMKLLFVDFVDLNESNKQESKLIDEVKIDLKNINLVKENENEEKIKNENNVEKIKNGKIKNDKTKNETENDKTKNEIENEWEKVKK